MKTAYRLHELFTGGSDLLGEGGREHHDLLVVGCSSEDLLDVSSHVCRVRMWPNGAGCGWDVWVLDLDQRSSRLDPNPVHTGDRYRDFFGL